MDELEPRQAPFENFQVAFMTIHTSQYTCPRVSPSIGMFDAQIMAEIGSIDMLANGFLIHLSVILVH